MATTNSGKKVFVCTTPQEADLTASTFAALTWVEVKGIGSVGETGTTTNILTYDTWGDAVVQKGKGMSNAGDPEIEVARLPEDPGQDAVRAACLINKNHAFKIVGNDIKTTSPTIWYYRGLVTGPRRPNGRNEDFDLEVFSIGLNQLEIVVDPV